MAILVALFSKIKQVFSSYVLMKPGESVGNPFVIGTSLYSMPLIYVIILGCVALIAYFCWQSYRQEISEEKLQENTASTEENYSSYNLTWINKLINWSYITSSSEIPDAIKRWMEDININLAKSESPIKILVYGIREGSMPPWIREIGQYQKVKDHVEIPVLLDIQEFGLTVSVQEEDAGKIIASTYTAVVSQFNCWYKVILSRIDGNILAKLEPVLERPHTINFNMKLLSDQKISTTVPEVVADIIKTGVLQTPFYVNVTTWGPVIPMSKANRGSGNTPDTKLKDGNGNTISRHEQGDMANFATPKKIPAKIQQEEKFSTPAANINGGIHTTKSSTMPLDTSRVISDHLKAANGLSGSLGSLIGIKRTPSGRGPAKPIRVREKRLVLKVIKSNGLPKDGVHYCQATLDYPHQKCKTKPVESGSNLSWADHELPFDLSARSSEVKLVLYQTTGNNQHVGDSAIASGVLHLDKIDIDKPAELLVSLKTVNKEPADITVKLDFTENPVDVTSARDSTQQFTSPRRSLDLSLMNNLPTLIDEKAAAIPKSRASTVSSFSSDNISISSSQRDCSPSTTVRTTTTKKVSPKRTPVVGKVHASKSAPNMHKDMGLAATLDVATVEGSVAETVMNDLSRDTSKTKESPDFKAKVKGKVFITAIKKTNVDEESNNQDEAITNGHEDNTNETETDAKPSKPPATDEMYYSISSISIPTTTNSSATASPREDGNKQEPDRPIVESPPSPEQSSDLSKPKKKHSRNYRRPKSLVSGVQVEDMPDSTNNAKDWPKVRRSRSLIFGKGKKKQHKTGSTTDLHKHANAEDEVDSGGFEDENTVIVPENQLQKHKKKKSKSITKIFSKLGGRPSIKKTRKDSVTEEGMIGSHEESTNSRNSSSTPNQDPVEDYKNIHITSPPTDQRELSIGSESESFISEATVSPSLSNSFNSSLNDDKSIKRSKSLRKRLFGQKRKSTKN